jgi:uncharacterized Ntn-hydrolase superfamily protein
MRAGNREDRVDLIAQIGGIVGIQMLTLRNHLCILLLIGLPGIGGEFASGQETFSIVAVDTATGQVGSAGASCVAGSIIISDVHPGVGAIHTQSYWNAANQNYARTLMNQGYSPRQIIDSLVAHDAQGNPSIRQYGVADLVGGGRSAAFTGVNCLDYKNHILGPNYSIQGNILLGQQILDSMETRFLNTAGTFTDRLMAALQGAKVPGADTRCLASGRSSISAFIRTARPQDTTGTFYLDLNVNNTPSTVEPIDSLRHLYDDWRTTTGVAGPEKGTPARPTLQQNYPNPFNPTTTITFEIPAGTSRQVGIVSLRVFDVLGREVATLMKETQEAGVKSVRWDASGMTSGVYFYRLRAGSYAETKKLVLLR